jgi:hypothetical protein
MVRGSRVRWLRFATCALGGATIFAACTYDFGRFGSVSGGDSGASYDASLDETSPGSEDGAAAPAEAGSTNEGGSEGNDGGADGSLRDAGHADGSLADAAGQADAAKADASDGNADADADADADAGTAPTCPGTVPAGADTCCGASPCVGKGGNTCNCGDCAQRHCASWCCFDSQGNSQCVAGPASCR